MKILFNYIKPEGEVRRRLLTQDEVLGKFGCLPHEEARRTGQELATDSTKKLFVFGDEGEKLVVKEWEHNTDENVRLLAHELIGRRIVSEINQRGIPLKDSKLSVPGAIGYTTDEGVFLVTRFCQGNPLDTESISTLPVKLKSRAVIAVLLSSLKTCPSSSMLLDTTSTGPELSLIDFESMNFDKSDFLPEQITLILLSMLMQSATAHDKGKDFFGETFLTGVDWMGILPRPGFKTPLINTLESEIGEPVLGNVTLSAPEIVDFLVELSTYYYKNFKFNIWSDGASSEHSEPVEKTSHMRELAVLCLGEIDKLTANLVTQVEHLKNGTSSSKEPPHTHIRRVGHTLKSIPRTFGKNQLKGLHDVASDLESKANQNLGIESIQPIADQLYIEVEAAKKHLTDNFIN